MIGVVLLGEGSAQRVLGLSVAMRALLALQAGGVTRVLLIGPDAAGMALAAATDERVRVRVEAATVWPAGGAVVVAPGVVLDGRAARALVAARPEAVRRSGMALAAVATEAAGSGLDDVPDAETVVPSEGVLVFARDAAGVRRATRELLASLRKPQDGWVSTRINRHVSLAVTRVLALTPLRPNPLSIAIMGIGVLGAWLASRGSYASLALGGVLFQLQSILDGCDGELSRLTFRGSKRGEWLDTIGDDVTNYGFFGGAAIGLHAMGFGALPLVVGGIGVGVGVLTSAIEYRYLISIGSGDLLKYPLGFGNDPEPTAATTGVARLLGAVRPAFKRDFFVFVTMLAALGGAYPTLVMLALFAAGACATCAAVLASEVRRARKAGS